MQVSIVLYDGFTALDVAGPFEVLHHLPDAQVSFVSSTPGMIQADAAPFALEAQDLDAVPDPQVLLVPGGNGTQAQLADERLLAWLRRVHETTQWTTAVCTGSMLLGAAGLLEGRPATTHWYELPSLAVFGAEPRTERIVESGRIITCAGVSAGVDMALYLCGRIAGDALAECVQLGIEYDPEPPYDSGSLAKASDDVEELVRAVFRESYGPPYAEVAASLSQPRAR